MIHDKDNETTEVALFSYFKGKRFEDYRTFADIKWLAWYANKAAGSNDTLHVLLTDAGYVLNEGKYVTKEQAARQILMQKTVNIFKDGEFIVEFTSNVSAESKTIRFTNRYVNKELYQYGYKLLLSDAFDNLIQWKEYKAREYGVVHGFGRSMKKKKANITVMNHVIAKIVLLA